MHTSHFVISVGLKQEEISRFYGGFWFCVSFVETINYSIWSEDFLK